MMMTEEELREILVDEDFTNEDFDKLTDDEINEMLRFSDVLQMLQSPAGNEEMLVQELKELNFIDVEYVKWYQMPYYKLKYSLKKLFNKMKGRD